MPRCDDPLPSIHLIQSSTRTLISQKAMAWFPARYAALPRSSFDIEDEVQDIKPREPQRIPLLQWKTHLLVFSLIANILFASSFVHALAFGGKHIKSHSPLPRAYYDCTSMF